MNIKEYQNYHESKPHTSSGFPYNTYLCSIPLDFIQVPLHWHEELELIVIKKGQGYVSVNFHSETVNAGDIVLILPGQLHRVDQKAGCIMEYENILFKPEILVSGENDLCANHFILPMLHEEMPAFTFITPACSLYPDFAAVIRHIDELCETQPQGYQLAVKGYLFHFFYFLISAQQNRDSVPKVKTKSLKKLKTILKYVEEHYTEPITIDDMSAITFYSKSHFMKFFKKHMGMGFIEYLNDYRLTMAARLLVTTVVPVIEVAARTGFDNLSYFNRLFKRKYNQPPGQYRKSIHTL